MVTIRRESFPVRRIQVKEIISDSVIGNADLYMDYDDMMQAVVVTMEQRMLAGNEQRVSAEASVKAETVNSVWDAVCVYWLAPLFALLYAKTNIEVFLRWEIWSTMHVELVEETDKDEKFVYTRFCPHIAVPDNQRHVEFLRTERELDFYGSQGY